MKDKGEISDGYHTFNELYKHRYNLFVALCNIHGNSWKSKKHSDGSEYKDYFVMGINKQIGKQITYHLPIDMWDECSLVETLDKAPEYDGHTSEDVLNRLLKKNET